MTGWELLAYVLAAAVVRLLWLRFRSGQLVRRRDRADQQLQQTLRRWF